MCSEVKPAETELKAKRVDFETLLKESDFISVHTDLNEKTRGMFGAAQFKQMKRSAVFVNTARGPLVDQKALVDALKSGTIFAAGLDVTDPEPPLPNDSAADAAEPDRGAAHRQRHGRHAQRHGRDLREEPDRRAQRRETAGVGESGCGRKAASVVSSQ